MTVYITLKTIRAPIIVAAPPPAEPAVEDWVVKGKGKGKRAPVTRRPISNTVVITKTGDLYHRDGCSYLTVGDSARISKTYGHCASCYPDERRWALRRIVSIVVSNAAGTLGVSAAAAKWQQACSKHSIPFRQVCSVV